MMLPSSSIDTEKSQERGTRIEPDSSHSPPPTRQSKRRRNVIESSPSRREPQLVARLSFLYHMKSAEELVLFLRVKIAQAYIKTSCNGLEWKIKKKDVVNNKSVLRRHVAASRVPSCFAKATPPSLPMTDPFSTFRSDCSRTDTHCCTPTTFCVPSEDASSCMFPWASEAEAKESDPLSPHFPSSTARPTDTVQDCCDRGALEDSYHDLCLGDASVLVLQDEPRCSLPLPHAPKYPLLAFVR